MLISEGAVPAAAAPVAAAPVAAAPVAAAPVAAAPIDFNIKSIDFIKDKEVRGTAKKAFMGAKEQSLRVLQWWTL